ncbi:MULTISPECIES: YjjG family noncanonical pyrimidine nucleotidase [Fictibacillus]|uniref:HAD family hydrolase n=1 Tax=Fictibacillus enclensis TaxID=1017270 RepID=A0A0V8JBJ6_9BACL|nr:MULTISPECIES: YjjG family noncanonical pyrimidine nucleotidase [Fictibacillus]KSU84567.1 HAD family hydrolase [Fictibacillus enclensis]RXY99797.1 noncanonical pyrimidine nucleotidase, YjjG family [Fictibacillus sp. S7]SCB81607.1 2-haloacid dehalogenase [Fictibacillus enclensis]
MRTYKTLLFDADDTLLDFKATEKAALRMLFEKEKLPFSDEMETHYRELNRSLWKAFEEGEIERTELLNTRFALFMKEYGHEADGVSMEKSYRAFLDEGFHLVDGAIELITELKDHYHVYIVTNGVSKTQDKRLRGSGLHGLFKGVFVSEDTGYQKPMKEYFDYVFERVPGFTPEETLIIGDSLHSDIKGGQLAGLDTCWFNPEEKPNDSGIVPTYEICKFDELYSILNRKAEKKL